MPSWASPRACSSSPFTDSSRIVSSEYPKLLKPMIEWVETGSSLGVVLDLDCAENEFVSSGEFFKDNFLDLEESESVDLIDGFSGEGKSCPESKFIWICSRERGDSERWCCGLGVSPGGGRSGVSLGWERGA